MIRVLDLFSGIGGFSRGLERTGGFETVAFCEIEEAPRNTLKKHWPGVPCYHDVRELNAYTLRRDGIAGIDCVTGGFPCQDVSIAGRGAGIDGARTGLWREFVRIVSEVRPRIAVFENSSKLRSRGLEVLLSALDAIGYDAEWHCIPASYVGAPHRRDRVWIIAHRKGDTLGAHANIVGSYSQAMHFDRGTELRDEQERVPGSMAWWRTEPGLERVVDGVPSRVDKSRIKQVGNAVVPFIVEFIGHAILWALHTPPPQTRALGTKDPHQPE